MNRDQLDWEQNRKPSKVGWVWAALFATICLAMFYVALAKAKHPVYYPPTTKPATVPVVIRMTPKFIVGVCQQPRENFKMLKALGINTLVDFPLNLSAADKAKWIADADALGFCQIREFFGDPETDSKDKFLIAVANIDEPETKKSSGVTTQTLIDTRAIANKYGLPTFTNFDGSRILKIQPTEAGVDLQSMIDASDWVSEDIYPEAGWMGNVSLYTPGEAADVLLKTGKPTFMYVECCRQGLWWLPNGGIAPTLDQMELIWRQGETRPLKGMIIYSISLDIGWPKGFWAPDDAHTVKLAQLIDRVK